MNELTSPLLGMVVNRNAGAICESMFDNRTGTTGRTPDLASIANNLCLVGIESIAFSLPENVLSYLFFGSVQKLAMSWSCKTSALSGNAGAVLTTSRNQRFFVPMVMGPY